MMEELEADLRAKGRADNVMTHGILTLAAYFFLGYAMAAHISAYAVCPGMTFGELTLDDRTVFLKHMLVAFGSMVPTLVLFAASVLYAALTRHKGEKGPEVLAQDMVGRQASILLSVFVLAGLVGCVVVEHGRGWGDYYMIGPLVLVALHLANDVWIYFRTKKKIAET